MTLGLISLGSAADIWDDEFSGFAYQPHKEVTPLLASSSSTSGNSVLQEGAKGYREGELSFTASSSSQKNTVRGYEEASTVVTFVDRDGSSCDVLVLSFEAMSHELDEWAVTVRLQQRTEPTGP